MPDHIVSYTLERSASGIEGSEETGYMGTLTGTIDILGQGGLPAGPGPADLSYSDPAVPNPEFYYRLTGTTADGVTLPFNVVKISVLPMGTLRVAPDPNDPTGLIFTWNIPDGLPLPITRFELTGKFLRDSDDQSTLLDKFTGGQQFGRASIVPTDDLTNPYTYSLTGFIDRE